MKSLIFDSEALSRVARLSSNAAKMKLVTPYLKSAYREGTPILIPAAVLAEQYRGGGHDQAIDAWLSRNSEFAIIVDTDRALAREIGHILAKHGRGTADHVDAAVVAVAARHGGGVILTSDDGDVGLFADGLPGIHVEILR